uniref:tetratricopeptide repeat protein n=1 Tax=Aliarcobacter sp. TaxID=2321116 RepID=UPI00404761D3
MKRLNKLFKPILSTFLVGIVSSSFAEDITSDELYSKALTFYQEKSYEKSYDNFNEYIKNNTLNKNIAFMLGRSAFEIGKYKEALFAYNRVLLEDPQNVRTKLEIAQTYFQMKEYDEAKKLFEEILNRDDIPFQVRENIKLTLLSLENKSKRNFLKGTLSFGVGYDSNIENYSSDYIDLTSSDEKSDEISQFIFALNHTYKVNEKMGLESKLIGFTQNYNTYKDKNIDLVIFGTNFSYYENNYKLSLGLDYNHVWLNGNHYLNNYILNPSLKLNLNKNSDYTLSGKIIKKDFIQTDYEYKDSILYEVSNSLTLLTQDFGLSILTLAVGKEKKDEGTHFNVDNEYVSLKYENKYQITSSFLLNNSLELYKDKYKEKDTTYNNTRRKNDRLTVSTELVKSINKNFSIGGAFSYINNQSNQDLFYKYNKYTTKTNIYYSF